MVEARRAGVVRRAQVAGSNLDWTTDPSTWTDAHEGHLVAAILTAAPANVQTSLTYVRDGPNWLGGRNPRGFTLTAPVAARLDDDRDSLDFDAAGLPPAPP